MSEQDLLHAIAKAKAEGMMSVYNGAELTDNGARFWLAMDGWDADQSAMLLNAIDPMRLARWVQISGGQLELSYPEKFEFVQALIVRAFEAGALRSPAKPSDVIAWAKSKGLRLPRQFLDGRSDNTGQAAQVVDDDAADTPQGRRAAAAMRARGVKRDILENWEDIARQYGPDADAAQVARFFSSRRDPSQPKRTRKTYHNRLGELRTAGLIP